MSQRDIAAAIEDLRLPDVARQISTITGCVMEEVEAWRNRHSSRSIHLLSSTASTYRCARYGVQQVAVYVMLAYDVNGCKDVLGLWINETESKHAWMQIFDELRARGVKDLGILSMDGVSGLEEGAKAVFPHATVQRCIVHLIPNSIRYIPKQWSAFTKQLKLIYGAINVKQARQEFEVQDRLAGLSGRGQRMGKQFLTRPGGSITGKCRAQIMYAIMPSRRQL